MTIIAPIHAGLFPVAVVGQVIVKDDIGGTAKEYNRAVVPIVEDIIFDPNVIDIFQFQGAGIAAGNLKAIKHIIVDV